MFEILLNRIYLTPLLGVRLALKMSFEDILHLAANFNYTLDFFLEGREKYFKEQVKYGRIPEGLLSHEDVALAISPDAIGLFLIRNDKGPVFLLKYLHVLTAEDLSLVCRHYHSLFKAIFRERHTYVFHVIDEETIAYAREILADDLDSTIDEFARMDMILAQEILSFLEHGK